MRTKQVGGSLRVRGDRRVDMKQDWASGWRHGRHDVEVAWSCRPLANAIVPLDRESMGRGTLGALEGSPGSSQAIGT